MIKVFLICFSLILLGATACSAQERYNINIPKEIIIIKSTKRYNKALCVAKEAARCLNKDFDLRRLKPNKKTGLTLSLGDIYSGRDIDRDQYPYYPARGNGLAANDDYVSVEYSNAYQGLSQCYYIVVRCIGDAGSAFVKNQLAILKNFTQKLMLNELTFGLEL
ncbi:hypothetical protein [Mucilaginibacter sp.]|uniref:hypothetical protein n=1 Tax=Mucilaginibacter sp. TaxID=1882438 RepID=UPI0035BC9544